MKDVIARSFVIIMVIIAITALFSRIAIERIIKINITQDESNAELTLKSIATAIENYARDHLGVFPTSLSVLTQNQPSYLDKSYITQTCLKGYNYSCPRLESSGYSCAAVPLKCKLTGKKIYTITTGGLLVSEECSGNE